MATDLAKRTPRRKSRGRSPTPKRITSSRKTPERRNRSASPSSDGRSKKGMASPSTLWPALSDTILLGHPISPSLPRLSRAALEIFLLSTSLGLTMLKDYLNRKILQKHVTSQHVMDGFATTLTACQFSFVALVLWTMRLLSLVSPKRFPSGTRRLRMALITCTALAPLASNFALLLNDSARTYHSLRAAQTMIVVGAEAAVLGFARTGSSLWQAPVLVAITIATAVQVGAAEGVRGLCLAGLLPTALTLALPPLFNIGVAWLMRDGWSPLQLLYSVFPWAAITVLLLANLQDDFAFAGLLPSLDTQPDTRPLSDSLALLIASSFFAFLAVWSQLIVIGGTSPTKYALLWHLSSALSLLFSSAPAEPAKKMGAAFALGLVVLYVGGTALGGGGKKASGRAGVRPKQS